MHEWNCGCCDHEPLTGPSTSPDGKELEYFSRHKPAFKALQKLVMDKQWLKSMKYYVRFWSVANCSVIQWRKKIFYSRGAEAIGELT